MYVKLTTDADEIVINTESVLDASKSVQVVYDRNTKRFLHETQKERRFLDFVIRVIWLKLRERLQ